jgi:hypothetical protein
MRFFGSAEVQPLPRPDLAAVRLYQQVPDEKQAKVFVQSSVRLM